MVKLEFHTGDKSTAKAGTDTNPNGSNLESEVSQQATPIMIGEVEFLTSPRPMSPPKTVDWLYIRRVSVVQMLLAFVAIICITIVVFTAEMNRLLMWSKTALFSWAIFLLTAGYCGYRTSTKNYCQLVSYFVMSIFQTMINGFWLALLFLAACYVIAYRDSYFETPSGGYWMEIREMKVDWNTGLLVVELVESLCLFAAIFTGLLGAFAGCRGFGRILQYQDGFIASRGADGTRY